MATITLKQISYWQVEVEEEDEQDLLDIIKEMGTITAEGEILSEHLSIIGERIHAWLGDDFENLLGYGDDWEPTFIEDIGGDE